MESSRGVLSPPFSSLYAMMSSSDGSTISLTLTPLPVLMTWLLPPRCAPACGPLCVLLTPSVTPPVSAYQSAFRRLSHVSRVLAYNVFVITKLSYLVKFLHISFSQRSKSCTERVVKARARRLILPVRGAYHYPFLVASSDLTSPAPPIKDA